MNPLFEEFTQYLYNEDKEKCVNFILEQLTNHKIDIVSLYSEILTPALNTMFNDEEQNEFNNIWKEHIRTSIIRTIIECAYPYILKERDEKGVKKRDEKVIIFCPSEEYHEIGARMIVDFFVLMGFDTVFIGANTPKTVMEAAIEFLNPKFIGISVTNYYHLVEAKKAVEFIRKNAKFTGKIIVGGSAFSNNKDFYKSMNADFLVQSYDQLKDIVEES